MKIEIIEKAWVLNRESVLEPWFIGDEVYYGTRGQAKAKALIDCDGLLNKQHKQITMMNISIIRNKQQDKVRYNGEIVSRNMIKELDRKEMIKKLPLDKFYYVQDNRSYVGNFLLFWGLGGSGYVTDIRKAHKYSGEEIRKFNPRDTDIIWESEHIESIIKHTVDCQYLEKEKSI